jgi:hypothetical protein
MVYGPANGATIDDTIAAALDYRQQGRKAIRIQCGVPGMASTYGVPGDRYCYETAQRIDRPDPQRARGSVRRGAHHRLRADRRCGAPGVGQG